MGCANRRVFHDMVHHAHNMYACLPNVVVENVAQRYWTAFDSYWPCLQDANRTADDCTVLVSGGFSTELNMVADSIPRLFESTLCASRLSVVCINLAMLVYCLLLKTRDTKACWLAASFCSDSFKL